MFIIGEFVITKIELETKFCFKMTGGMSSKTCYTKSNFNFFDFGPVCDGATHM